ncbi:MAG: hypothetical protein WC360_06670 [Opitutales bacterium]|jgi:hypothetical protein
MELSAEQLARLREWAATGTSLSVVQKRLDEEFGIRMTYMQVRFLMDDKGIEIDSPKPKPAPEPPKTPEELPVKEAEELMPVGVSVTLDRLTRPGSVVSGDVTFSDGVRAKWYLDKMGRLGLDGADDNYRPSPEDVQEFQMELQSMLQEKGF